MTAFKTISMRIRGAKTELEEAGLETDGMVESTATLRKEILALSGVDIMQADGQTFKSTYAIMDELAQKWEELSDIQQATVTELIAGKRQGNIVSSLMSNFDTARDALETSLSSSGSAMAEHEKWQKSLEARINNLKAAWQSLSQTFLNSDFLKVGIDILVDFVNVLDKIIDSFGILGTVGFGTSLFKIIKNFEFTNFKIFSALPSELKGAGMGFKALGHDMKSFIKTSAGVTSAIGLTVAIIGLAVNAYKNLREEQAKLRQETIQTSDEYLNAADSFEQAYVKYSGKTDLTVEEEAELESAIKGTVDALNNKSSALQRVVNGSNDYVFSLEQIAKAELKAADTAARKKKQAAKEELEWTAIGEIADGESEVDVHLRSAAAILLAQEIMGEEYVKTTKRGKDNSKSSQTITLSTDASADDILNYYYNLLALQERMLNPDVNMGETIEYERITATIDKMKDAVAAYESGVIDAAKAQYQLINGIPKTAEEYLKMRESILGSEGVSNLSLNAKQLIASNLDSEYNQIFDLTSAEIQARKFIGLIKNYGDGTVDGTNEIGTVETFLNMRTAVNNNECTVGEYMAQFDEIDKMTKNWSDEEKELLNTSFALDTDAIKQQYADMRKYLLRHTVDGGERDTKEIENFLEGLTADELSAVIAIRTEIDWENTSAEKIRKQIADQVELNEALSFNVNFEIDTAALEALNTALSESASAIGLTTESINSLESKYSDLEGYDASKLFEATANGVKVNREELAKLEKEQNDLAKSELQEHLDTLTDKYNDVTAEIDDCNNASKRAELLAERETYADKIKELATYQAQLEGVTGAYQRWLDAQDTPESYEGYEAVATSREDIQDEINRGFLGNATKEYIDLLSGEDLQGGTIDDYAAAWGRLDNKITGAGHSINDFFTVNDDGDITATGIDRFFNSLQTDFEGSVAKFNEETKKWEYDFSQENLKKIQDEWGIGIEAIELLLEAAVSAGYNVDWGGILDGVDLDISSFETLIQYAESAQKAFNDIEGIDDVDFNFATTNIKEAEAEIEKARSIFASFINADGTINLEAEGAEEVQFILTTLLIQKQQLGAPAIMKVDTSQIDQAETEIIEVINAAKNLQSAYENYEIAISTGVDVEEAKTELNNAISALEGTDADIRASLSLPSNEELQAAAGELGTIKVGATLDETAVGVLEAKIQTECTPEVIAKVTGLDETAITNGDGGRQVVYTPEHKAVDDYVNGLEDVNRQVIFTYTTAGEIPNPSNINRTITYTVKTNWLPEANGTANVNGTTANSSRAFARGDWGIKGSGTALVGELGMETLVRGGKFYTIGNQGAEFIQYRPNDIIFNHKQTEELFKYGKVLSDGGRGKVYANGSAFANGSYPYDGRAFWNASASSSIFAQKRLEGATAKAKKASTQSKTTTKDNSVTTTTTTTWNANASESDFTSQREETGTTTDTDKFEETFDWVEVAISRIERAISQLDQKANNVYKSWSERNSALASEISKVGEEISLQQSAYNRYIQEANSVGLDESYAKKVRNGTIDIEDFEGTGDEALVEKIKEYQTWYEKALACQDAILELKETESSLYAQRFEHIQAEYEGILQGYEHTEAMLNEYISQAEAKGHIVSKSYYDELIKNEQNNINALRQEQAALVQARDEAVASGKITKGSEAW